MASADRVADAERLLAALHGDNPTVDHDEQRLRVAARDGATTLVGAVRLFDDAHIVLADIGLRRPSLDDVFLALTGRDTASAA